MALTTYERVAEQVERRLSIYTIDSDILRPELILAIKQRVSLKILTRFYQIKNEEGWGEIDGAFIYTFKNISVAKDDDMDAYFAPLPSSYPDLLYGMGIKQVSPSKEPKTFYVPVKNGFEGLYKDLGAEKLEGSIGYYPENFRIYFVNMDGSNNPPSVLIKITLPLDGIAPNTQVNIPSDIQAEVIEEVVAMYSQKLPADDTKNANDKP